MRSILFLSLALLGACSDPFYYRTLDGQVVNSGQRYSRNQTGGQEKIALVVQPIAGGEVSEVVVETAGGPSGVAIECLSTRCASLLDDTCHRFKCARDVRWTEPSIIQCKHAKELACGGIK